jgi:hypothetical protein
MPISMEPLWTEPKGVKDCSGKVHRERALRHTLGTQPDQSVLVEKDRDPQGDHRSLNDCYPRKGRSP